MINMMLHSMDTLYNSRKGEDLNKLKMEAASRNKAKLKKACSDFEAIFIKQMLDSMRKTVNKSGLLDGGMAENIFEDMLYDKYAHKMSETAHFGIKDILYKQLSGVQKNIQK